MDDLDSSMFLMKALAGPMAAMVMVMVTFTVFAPVVLYLIARWRAHREPQLDTQLGIKFALHYFAISAFHLALAGGTLLVWALLSKIPSEYKGSFYRTAFGMLLPAGLVLGAHLSLLKKTNDAEVPGVRRLFPGYNLNGTGLFGFVALVIAFQALLMKGSSGELGRAAAAMVLVYGTAWAVIGWRFGQIVLGRNTGSGQPPMQFPTSAPPTTPPSAASGGVPSLGNAYPPIEPPKS